MTPSRSIRGSRLRRFGRADRLIMRAGQTAGAQGVRAKISEKHGQDVTEIQIQKTVPFDNESAPVDEEPQQDLLNRSVLRSSALLSALGGYPKGANAAELGSAVGLPRATAYRLLASLTHAGMVVNNNGIFTLGWEVVRLGRLADPRQGLLPHVQVVIDRLASVVSETVAYVVITGPTGLDVIAVADGPHMLSTAKGDVGSKFPLHASAAGKLLLSNLTDDQVCMLLPEELQAYTPYTITDRSVLLLELADIRVKGYAVHDDELEEGLFAVSVPVIDSTGHWIGIITAQGLNQRMKAMNVHTFLQEMQRSSSLIAQAIAAPQKVS